MERVPTTERRENGDAGQRGAKEEPIHVHVPKTDRGFRGFHGRGATQTASGVTDPTHPSQTVQSLPAILSRSFLSVSSASSAVKSALSGKATSRRRGPQCGTTARTESGAAAPG